MNAERPRFTTQPENRSFDNPGSEEVAKKVRSGEEPTPYEIIHSVGTAAADITVKDWLLDNGRYQDPQRASEVRQLITSKLEDIVTILGSERCRDIYERHIKNGHFKPPWAKLIERHPEIPHSEAFDIVNNSS